MTGIIRPMLFAGFITLVAFVTSEDTAVPEKGLNAFVSMMTSQEALLAIRASNKAALATSGSISQMPVPLKYQGDPPAECPNCEVDVDTNPSVMLIDESGNEFLQTASGGAGLIIYGRSACGLCTQLMSELDREGIEYTFKSVSCRDTTQEMWPKIRASGLNTGSVGLPVVDVYGKMAIRPSLDAIKNARGSSGPSPAGPSPAGPSPSPAGAAERRLAEDLKKLQSKYDVLKNQYVALAAKVPATKGGTSTEAPGPGPTPTPPTEEEVARNGGVVVYGRPSCGMCQGFITRLKSANMAYKMVNIDVDGQGRSEMFKGMQAAGFTGGRFGLPVVSMCGQVKIRPSITDVEEYC